MILLGMHVGLYPIWPWTGLSGPKPPLIGIYSFTKGLVLLQPLPSQLSGERAMQTLGDLLTGFMVKLFKDCKVASDDLLWYVDKAP